MALSNTIATFTAYDKKQPIGMVRLIGDGGITHLSGNGSGDVTN